MNIADERYYYHKHEAAYYDVPRPFFEKFGNHYYVFVDEDVEIRQRVSITYHKSKEIKFEKPYSTEQEKVKPVIKEIFYYHFNLAIRILNEMTFDDGEFYILKINEATYSIAYFDLNKPKRNAERKIIIDFTEKWDLFRLAIYSGNTVFDRRKFRKEGICIDRERFTKFVNCTLQYFNESISYDVLLNDFVRKFFHLIEDEGSFEGFLKSVEKSDKEILGQLVFRKQELERRLIESDNDTDKDRLKLRGELDGINYAIKTFRTSNS